VPNDPDKLVILTTARTEFEANTIATALNDDGIPAKVFTGAASVLQLGTGSLDTVKVMVRAADRERAAARLRAIKQDSVDIDWSEVDVGDTIDPPDAFAMCPACGYDRSGVRQGQPCPECGYKGIAANRATPAFRSWRPWIRRAGVILMGGAVLANFAAPSRNPGLALLILGAALVMIFLGYSGRRN
jgi:hypothetical protein